MVNMYIYLHEARSSLIGQVDMHYNNDPHTHIKHCLEVRQEHVCSDNFFEV